jgi:hypothetical protein
MDKNSNSITLLISIVNNLPRLSSFPQLLGCYPRNFPHNILIYKPYY